MSNPTYLDYNATTPLAPEVISAITGALSEFGNPSSSHAFGLRARALVQAAREELATLIGASADEIYFTGCATESNNLALLGVAAAAAPTRRHLVISGIEHPAVMQPALALKRQGWDLTVLDVDRQGRVDPEAAAQALRPDTALISVMHSNNEVGTIQPVKEIAATARDQGVLVHTDAAQSIGKVRIDVNELGVDLLTIAGHKFYAPKGVGALYVRKGTPIRSVLFGADHERGIRPGTENVVLIAGLGAAAKLCNERGDGAESQLKALRDALHQALTEGVPGLELNGHPEHRLPNTLNVSFPGVSGRELLANAPQVAASVGSACHSEGDAVSGVLAAMGTSSATARGAIRLSVGLMTTEAEVASAAAQLVAAYRKLR